MNPAATAPKKPWYETWFDSAYYHILYDNRDEAEADAFLKKLLAYLKPEAAASFLDLGCGAGRHTSFLARQGYTASGADLSERSIARAKERYAAIPNLDFKVQDMRAMEDRQQYDYVLSLFTSFGYFDTTREDQQVLNQIHSALKPGGTLVLDFLNANYVQNKLIEEEIVKKGGIEFYITREIVKGDICKTIEFEVKGRELKFQEKVHLYGLDDFKAMFAAAGLTYHDAWGSYTGEPFESNISPRLILFAGAD